MFSISHRRCKSAQSIGRTWGLSVTKMLFQCPGPALPSLSHALNFSVPSTAQASPLQRALPGRRHFYKACLPYSKEHCYGDAAFPEEYVKLYWPEKKSLSYLRGGQGAGGTFPKPSCKLQFPLPTYMYACILNRQLKDWGKTTYHDRSISKASKFLLNLPQQ